MKTIMLIIPLVFCYSQYSENASTIRVELSDTTNLSKKIIGIDEPLSKFMLKPQGNYAKIKNDILENREKIRYKYQHQISCKQVKRCLQFIGIKVIQ
jgi:hypothetical protein